MPPAKPGALLDDWKQRAAAVQGHRELAGITDPAAAIGPAPARQGGMSEAFAASVRALALPDDAALAKAMGRGDLEAREAEPLTQIMAADRDRLQVADAARREWEEAIASMATAVEQARAELDHRDPARWSEFRPAAADVPELQADDPTVKLDAAQAEMAVLES